MSKAIELRKVDKVYTNGVTAQALFEIDLDFDEASFSSIIGSSGSGKSTLLNIMGTLDRPTRGEVYIGGRRVDQMSRREIARVRNEQIGFVFQFHYLLPDFTALENILMPHWIRGRSSKDIEERAEELMELVGISQVKNNLATKMSGGQQQRTSIARALMNNPKLILADEPSGNLDSENTANLYRLFRKINEEFDTTFIIVTHDRKLAEQTDRIVEMGDGRIVMDIHR